MKVRLGIALAVAASASAIVIGVHLATDRGTTCSSTSTQLSYADSQKFFVGSRLDQADAEALSVSAGPYRLMHGYDGGFVTTDPYTRLEFGPQTAQEPVLVSATRCG